MNILYYCWNENSSADIEQAFSNLEISFAKITSRPSGYDSDPALETQINEILRQYKFGAIYTFNYFPILSSIAQKHDLPYFPSLHYKRHPTALPGCPPLIAFFHCAIQITKILFLYHIPHPV